MDTTTSRSQINEPSLLLLAAMLASINNKQREGSNVVSMGRRCIFGGGICYALCVDKEAMQRLHQALLADLVNPCI